MPIGYTDRPIDFEYSIGNYSDNGGLSRKSIKPAGGDTSREENCVQYGHIAGMCPLGVDFKMFQTYWFRQGSFFLSISISYYIYYVNLKNKNDLLICIINIPSF